MTFEGLEFFAFEIPQFDGIVVTGSGNGLTIWTKGYATDTITMGKAIFFLDSIDRSKQISHYQHLYICLVFFRDLRI